MILNWLKTVWALRGYLSFKKLPKPLLASFGTLWLLTQVLDYFSPAIAMVLPQLWWFFLLVGVAWAMFSCLPRYSFACPVTGRDVTVELRVGDIFDVSGAVVVPTNTSFDVQLPGKELNPRSLQGQVLQRYYDGDLDHHEMEIKRALADESLDYEALPESKPGRSKKFAIGSVVKLRRRGRLLYLTALTHVDEAGELSRSEGDLRTCLEGLWSYIGQKGEVGTVVLPPLGTGYSRVPVTREESIRLIVRSFIQSCSRLVHTNHLVIVLSPETMEKHQIDHEYLCSYLVHACRTVAFEGPQNPATPAH